MAKLNQLDTRAGSAKAVKRMVIWFEVVPVNLKRFMKSEKFLTFKRNALHVALVSTFAMGSMAVVSNAYAAAASSTATSTVVAPIAITTSGLAVLSFGKFGPTGASSTVIISNSGVRSGTAVLVGVGTTTAARFNVTGDANSTYAITHTALTVLTGISGAASTGPQTMALAKTSDLTGANVTTGNVASGTLSGAGAERIYVGGTLTVGASQATGTYTGTVEVTVEYN